MRSLEVHCFEKIFKMSPDLFTLSTLEDAIYVAVNDGFTRILGYTESEVLGKSAIDLGIWVDIQDRNKVMEETKKKGIIQNLESHFRAKDGTIIPVLISANLTNIDGIIHLLLTARDISKQKKVEIILRESEERFRTLHDNAGIGIGYYDLEGRIIAFNQIAAKNMGGRPSDYIGKSLYDFFSKTDADLYVKRINAAALSNEPMAYEDTISTPSGDITFLSTHAKITDEFGHILGVQVIADNITNRKRAENMLISSEKKLHDLFSSMMEGFAYHQIIMDEHNRPIDYIFLEMNHSFEKLTGLKRQDAVGKKVTEVIPGIEKDSTDWIGIYGKVALSGESISFENYSAKLNKWYKVSAYSPQPGYFATLFQDITERKQAQNELKRFNTQLEERVKQRTMELEQSYRILESFSYSVSHDLRAPLRAINGFSELLIQGYQDKLDEEGKRLLQVIIDNSRRMDKLIQGLLALSRVSSGEMIKASIDMNLFLKDIYEELIPESDRARINFQASHILTGYGDKVLLRQVWTNLIENAVKFTKYKENPAITVDSYKKDQQIVYSIRDNGAGFNSDYSNKLFQAFQRLHNPTEFEGMGIGLTVVERIVLRHGGKVWAEGVENQGATFYFSLPKEEG